MLRLSQIRTHCFTSNAGDCCPYIAIYKTFDLFFPNPKLFTSHGGVRSPLASAAAGDIVSVAGLSLATVTDTVASVTVTEPLPASPIDPPTLKMTFGVNDSKLGGREGKNLTGRNIWDRLVAEAETNVALRVLQDENGGGDRFEVQGRGELHLGVLIETMRRENFELSVSPPAVLFKDDPERPGKKLEPLEEVLAEVDEEHVGGVIEALSVRKGDLVDMQHGAGEGGRTKLEFLCPSRGLIGFRSVFINETRGTGTMHRSFHGYGPYRGALDKVRKGAIISSASGVTTTYALGQLESRGSMFVGPKVEVYEGTALRVSQIQAHCLRIVQSNYSYTWPEILTLPFTYRKA